MQKLFFILPVLSLLFSCALFDGIDSREEVTGYLYIVGGVATSSDAENIDPELDVPDDGIHLRSVLIADVDEQTNTISNWRRARTTLPSHHFANEGVLHWSYLNNNTHVYNGRLYAGPAAYNAEENSVRPTDFVVWADIDPSTGDLSAFEHSDRLPDPPGNQRISASTIMEVNEQPYYYVMGGNTDEDVTDWIAYAEIDKETGAIGEWSLAETKLLTPDWFNAATNHQGRLIHASGHGRTDQMAIDFVTPDQDGNISDNWGNITYSTDYARRWDYVMLEASVNETDYLYLLGGAAEDVFVTDRVDYGVFSDGVPADWEQGEPLPRPGRRFAGAALNDTLFLFGGTVEDSDLGTDDIFIGTVSANGEVEWTVSSDSMYQARTFHGAAIYEKE